MEQYKIFKLKEYHDNRGSFFESFSKNISNDLNKNFYQDNISVSKKGVVRGLHYQWYHPMGKLVQAVKGSIIDHIVDIRFGSINFGKCYSFELSEKNRNVLWVPPGFAHGFECLEDSVVLYKCTSYYNKENEASINFFDKQLKINLTISKKEVIISERDKNAISFEQYCRNPKFL